ncbi:hypothetical protein GF345_05120 [Candidatus Woesearchaeota archaeon]|nr:hypothetical protein [Candidatus Woesearchaeota archaeon]
MMVNRKGLLHHRLIRARKYLNRSESLKKLFIVRIILVVAFFYTALFVPADMKWNILTIIVVLFILITIIPPRLGKKQGIKKTKQKTVNMP